MIPPLRALIVTYVFPPVGGAGVQRPAKLCKYLPEHGVVPTVLTAANPSVPLTDPSLLRDVAPGLRILRARTLEPGYEVKRAAWAADAAAQRDRAAGPAAAGRWTRLTRQLVRGVVGLGKQLLIPDPQVLWQPGAQLALARVLIADPPDVILVTAPPFSQFLLSPLAQAIRRGIAVVLDYRDEWTMYREVYEMMGPAAARAGEAMEGWLVRRAHGITTATAAFRDNLLRRFPELDPDGVVAIPNGFDSDDFPADLPLPGGDRFRLAYAGTVLRANCPRGFLAALRLLHEREPRLGAKLEVEFLGRIVDTEAEAFAGSEALGVVRRGYVAHDEVLPALSRSHGVLCCLADVPGAESMYPGKIFELMYLGRPVFTFAPKGALRDLVQQHRLGPTADPDDVPGIAAILEGALRAWERGEWSVRSAAVGVARYHRRELAGEFARALRAATARAHRGERLGTIRGR